MPINYAPGITDQRAQIISNTGNAIANDIGQSIATFQANKRKDDFADGQFEAYVQSRTDPKTGQPLDPSIGETIAKWHGFTPDKKLAFLGQKAADEDFQQKQQQAQQRSQVMNMQLQNAIQEFSQRGQTMPAVVRQANSAASAGENAGKPVLAQDGTTQVGVFDANGSPHLFSGSMTKSNEPIQMDPLIDPATKKPVAGKAVNRLTGQVVDTGEGAPELIIDPTNRFYFDNHARTWRPLAQPKAVDPQKAAMAALLTGATPGAPAAAPGPIVQTPTARTQKFRLGAVNRQNGHTYQFDGTKWNLIQ